MVLLDVLGLGISEMIIVVIAIILLIEPRNMVYIKPLVKAAYKIWLSYRAEVEKAQREMEGVRQGMMEPLLSAKREVETEMSQAGAQNRKLGETIKKEIQEARNEVEKARKGADKPPAGPSGDSGAVADKSPAAPAPQKKKGKQEGSG